MTRFSLLVVAAGLLLGCETASSTTTTTDAGVGADAAPLAWSSGTCGACVLAACSRERTLCDAEPSCSAHASCVEACASADGELDARCVDACPLGEGSAASRARAAYDTCVATTGPRACAVCQRPAESSLLSPILDQTCGPSAETNTCFKCEDDKCCATLQACVDEPECKQALQPCVVACATDNTCRAKCYADHPKGVAAWARRQACLTVNCVTECGGTVDPCTECAIMKGCRDSYARCAADEGCFLLRSCIDATCPDQKVTDSCLKACKAKVAPSAGALFDAWTSCFVSSCTNTCG